MTKIAALEKTKIEVEQFAVDAIQQNQMLEDQKDVILAFGVLGGMRLVSKFISLSVIKLLQQVRDEKKFKQFGYTEFKDFLENDPLPQAQIGISYKTFKNHENQMLAEGDELYELLNRIRIPISTRQLLAKNGEVEIAMEGDKITIGDKIYDLEAAETTEVEVKEAIKNLAKEAKRRNEDNDKSNQIIKSLREELKIGSAEYQELQRAMDAQTTGTPYEQALTKAVGALINLTLAAKDATLIEKDARGRHDIETLWKQMLLVRTALYQDNFAFIDDTKVDEPETIKGISKRAMQAVAAIGDDFGDELEG